MTSFGGREWEQLAVHGCLRRLQQFAYFGRNYIFTSRLVVKKAAIPSLGKTEAIPGRNVIIANARAPCGFQDCVRILVSYHGKFVPQGNASQAEVERRLVAHTAAAVRVFHTVPAPALAGINLRRCASR